MIDAIPRYVEMAKGNGTWLVATLSLDDRIVETMRDAVSLARRFEFRYLPPQEFHDALQDNPDAKRASEGSIRYVQDLVDFNRRLVSTVEGGKRADVVLEREARVRHQS